MLAFRTSRDKAGSTRRRRPNRVYDLVHGFNAWSLRTNWRLRIEGAEHLDIDGPAIIAFNHLHLVDGTVVVGMVPRRVRFLCDDRALRIPGLAQVLRAMRVIPVNVSRPDRRAAAASARALRRGELLGIFPEGRVSGEEGLLPARRGLAYLADRFRVPVVPVAMRGVSAFDRPFDVYVRRRRPAIDVRVGQGLSVILPGDNRDAIAAAADAIMLSIAELLPPELRGVYSEDSERSARGRSARQRGWVSPASPG